jgi:hypothetical protein
VSQPGDRPDAQPAAGGRAGGPLTSRFGLDRFTLLIALGALALVGLLLALVLLRPNDSQPMDESSPAGVVHNFYLALLNDDPARAYTYLSAEAQSKLSYEQFVQQRAGRGTPPRLRIAEERTEGETARVTVSRTYGSRGGFFPFGPDEYTSTQTLVLRREGGAWKLAPDTPPGFFPYGW